MVVFILERVPAGLRGQLTRWLIEPKSSVFVGKISAMVREKLWELVCDKLAGGACLMIYSSNTEQGFKIRSWGKTARMIEDFEGLFLVRVP